MKKIIPVCPDCGGEVIEKRVEKLVKGGCNAAVLTVEAGVCTKFGEHYIQKKTMRRCNRLEKNSKRDIQVLTA